MNLKETEILIKLTKDEFEKNLSKNLNLLRVSAPLFVSTKSGLNDNLTGKEKAVSFNALNIKEPLEIVHSLAKWKRMALKRYEFNIDEGLYTDMNAIRREETVDHLHSFYVDQWDWEKIITNENRTRSYLHEVVNKIVLSLKMTQDTLMKKNKDIKPYITNDVFFITSEELLNLYPNLTAKERENEITRLKKVVFIEQIGDKLSNGIPHDLRSPDYDDWKLNGDLLIYHPILDEAIEVSSMGIRVNKDSLLSQLEKTNTKDRLIYPYHQMIVNDELPLTIGGGIGQSRICLILLNKKHIAEVQSSVWPKEIEEELIKKGIKIL